MAQELSPADRAAIVRTAARLGIAPADLTAVMMYETKGTLNPDIRGGTGGNYKGLIQFGPSERRTYGYQPGMTIGQQVEGPVFNYLSDRGVRPGMDLAHIYSVVNAGSLKNGQPRWNRSDGHGTIRSHVARIRNQFAGLANRLMADPVPLPNPRPDYAPIVPPIRPPQPPPTPFMPMDGRMDVAAGSILAAPPRPNFASAAPTEFGNTLDRYASEGMFGLTGASLPGQLGSGPGPSVPQPPAVSNNRSFDFNFGGVSPAEAAPAGPNFDRTVGPSNAPVSVVPPLPAATGTVKPSGPNFDFGVGPADAGVNVVPPLLAATGTVKQPPSLAMPVGLPQSMPRYIEDELFTGPPTATTPLPGSIPGPKTLPAGDLYAQTPPDPYLGPAQTAVQPQQQRRGIFGGGGILGALTGGQGLFGGVFQPRTSTGRFANGSATRFATGATASPFVGVGGRAYGPQAYNYASGTTPSPFNPHP
jgi:hypothetical protein